MSNILETQNSQLENVQSNDLPMENETNQITNSEVNHIIKPLQIVIIPPSNKQFILDEESQTIRVESIKETKQNNVEVGNNEEEIVNMPEIVFEQTNVNRDVHCVTKIEKVFSSTNLGRNCFLKGCKWSPDGTCLLSCSDDSILRLFEFSNDFLGRESFVYENDNIEPVLQMKEGGTVYDYVWYPKMNSLDPISCVLASCSQDSPIHLWDAYTGQLRATYQPVNNCDEVIPAYSLCFTTDGTKLYSGYKKSLRIFDITHPGRVSEERSLKMKGEVAFQSNIISTIAINPAFSNIYALGSYDKSIGIYTEPDGELQCLLKGHSGGITQVLFSPDGTRLYSGGRKDTEILCWDLRKPGNVLFSIRRAVSTNQRIYFDLTADGSHLFTGSTDGLIKVFNTKEAAVDGDVSLAPKLQWKAHNDCTNGVSIHPLRSIIASSSGQRHGSPMIIDDEDEDDDEDETIVENNIRIWSYKWG